jgi:magnesium chelatase family protein
MLSKVLSASVVGIDAYAVEVEVDIASRGLPHFSLFYGRPAGRRSKRKP